jgi:hypothetical protein
MGFAPAAVLAGVALAGPAQAGVSGPAFWIDGALYRTVATPTPALVPVRVRRRAGLGRPDGNGQEVVTGS